MTPQILENEKKEIRKVFNSLWSEHLEMAGADSTDEYWTRRDKFVIKLRAFIRMDFSKLTAIQVLQVCSMVSTYRPVELHTFLIYCAKLAEA